MWEKKRHEGTHENSKLQLVSTVWSAIGVTVRVRVSLWSRTPQGDEEYPYLITEDWDADMPFVVDPRVVDLRREFHLRVTADKINEGDRCNRVGEIGQKEVSV